MNYILHEIPSWCQKLLLDFINKLNIVMKNDKLRNYEKEHEINKLILELRDGIANVQEDFDLRPYSLKKVEIWSEVLLKCRPATVIRYLKVTLPEWVERLLWALKCIDIKEN